MAKSQIEAWNRHKAEKKARRRDTDVKVFDRRDLTPPKGVIPATDTVRGPLDEHNERSKVTRNLREDTLGYMRIRGQLDEHQYIAGRHWQEVWEASVGTVPAMDTTKEPVDGGGAPSDGLTEKRKRATKELLRADLSLGPEGAYIMRHIAGSGLTIAQEADRRGISAKTMGKRFRECLDILAVEFGYADRRALTLPAKQVESA